MTVWAVGKKLFVCSPCAIRYYNADRDSLSAPNPVVPEDGAVVLPCAEEA